MVPDEKRQAIAVINMLNYLERELRVGLDEQQLAERTGAIIDEMKRKFVVTDQELPQLKEGRGHRYGSMRT